jgi:hypothetical protein
MRPVVLVVLPFAAGYYHRRGGVEVRRYVRSSRARRATAGTMS